MFLLYNIKLSLKEVLRPSQEQVIFKRTEARTQVLHVSIQ